MTAAKGGVGTLEHHRLNDPVALRRFEPRWPAGLAVLSLGVLLALLPARIRLVPTWVSPALGIILIAPMVAVGLTHARRRWIRVERIVTLIFCVTILFGTVTNLAVLISVMAVGSRGVGGVQLFMSSVAVWTTNVLTFALLYWHLDRGGPETRASHSEMLPDWLFPQQTAPDGYVRGGWKPAFVDYLFLGYSTATAFSTTDVVPLTARAKLLMMVESSISLLTIAVIAARAINILSN